MTPWALTSGRSSPPRKPSRSASCRSIPAPASADIASPLTRSTWRGRRGNIGQDTRFIKLAGEINTAMPRYVVERMAAALNARQKSVRGSKILVLGLAYKPNVDDDRESPGYHLLNLLKKRGRESRLP